MWSDQFDDIRYSLNDIYMAFLMTGWMFFFMGLIYHHWYISIIGIVFILLSLWCIRKQFFINQKQYINGMIPHHSMAIHMSKKLLNKQNTIQPFLQNIIENQENEIVYMKQLSK